MMLGNLSRGARAESPFWWYLRRLETTGNARGRGPRTLNSIEVYSITAYMGSQALCREGPSEVVESLEVVDH